LPDRVRRHDSAFFLLDDETTAVIMNAIHRRESGRWIFLALAGLTFVSMSGDFPVETAGSLANVLQLAAEQTRFDYDAAGNLRSVVLPDGTKVDYVIDGANRRTGKKVDGTLVQRFLYDGAPQIAAELDGEGRLVSQFVYRVGGHVPDYFVRGGRKFRLIVDHLGSVRLVVDSQSGEVAQRLDYDEFGVVVRDTQPGFQPFGYAGGLYDRHTRLTRFGARDYDAETGRWTNRDPILFAGGQANLYTYVLGDPVNSFDPYGLQGGQADSGQGSSAAPQSTGVSNQGSRTGWHPIYNRISDYFSNPPNTGPEPYTHEWAGEPSSPPIYCPRGPDRPPRAPGDFYRSDDRNRSRGRPAAELNETNFPTSDIKVEAEEKADTAIGIRG
jgi:RHS repeat-associated protein